MEEGEKPKVQDTGQGAENLESAVTKDLGDEELKKRFTVKRRPKRGEKDAAVLGKLFPNARRKFVSVSRRVKSMWKVWVNFKGTKEDTGPMESKDNKSFDVPGFEEIACIEAEVPDLMTTDKDKVRTSCARCQEKPPSFPTKEQIKSKLIAADKYYGTTGLKRNPKNSRGKLALEHDADYYDEDGCLIRPSWRFILERPLVEQYVLMTNYIRKVSVLSELASQDNAEFIEEPDSDNDEEIEKFTKKHKSETEQLLKSMNEPKKKNMEVQTMIKFTDDILQDVMSEASLYPESDLSDESSKTGDLSAATIVTSKDLSSPFQSDFDSRVTTETVPSAAAPVKWWESREFPQTSESFPTSCDSVGKMTSSGSDGASIPIHSAHAMTALVPGRGKQWVPPPFPPRRPLIEIVQETQDESRIQQKKVTFSPVIHYYHVPERNAALYQLPNYELNEQYPPSDDRITTSKLVQDNQMEAKEYLERGGRISTTTAREQKRTGGITAASCLRTLKMFSPDEDKQQHQNQNPAFTDTNFRGQEVRVGDHDKNQNVQQMLENSEESSSTSGERIALKATPARVFKPKVLLSTSIESMENVDYPEVPELDDSFGEDYEENVTAHTRYSKQSLVCHLHKEAVESKRVKSVEGTSSCTEENEDLEGARYKPNWMGTSTPHHSLEQTGSVATYTSSIMGPHSMATSKQLNLISTISTGRTNCPDVQKSQQGPGSSQPAAISKANCKQREKVYGQSIRQPTQVPQSVSKVKRDGLTAPQITASSDDSKKLQSEMQSLSQGITLERQAIANLRNKEKEDSINQQNQSAAEIGGEKGVHQEGNGNEKMRNMVDSSTVTTLSLEGDGKMSGPTVSASVQTSKEQVIKKIKCEVMPNVKHMTAQLSQLPQSSSLEGEVPSQGKIIDMPKISRSIEELKNIFEKKQETQEKCESINRVSSRTTALQQVSPKQEGEGEKLESLNRKSHELLGNRETSASGGKIENVSRGREKSRQLHDGKMLAATNNGHPSKEEQEEKESEGSGAGEIEKLDIIKASQIYSMSSAYFYSEDRLATKQKTKAHALMPIAAESERISGSPLETTNAAKSDLESGIGQKAGDSHLRDGQKEDNTNEQHQGLEKSRVECSAPIQGSDTTEKEDLSTPMEEFDSYVESILLKVEEQVGQSSGEINTGNFSKQWLMDVIPIVPATKLGKSRAQAGSSQGRGQMEMKPVFQLLKKPSEGDKK